MFLDEKEETSRLITLWETPADERGAREARGARRDQLLEVAGLDAVSFGVYEVPAHEYVAG